VLIRHNKNKIESTMKFTDSLTTVSICFVIILLYSAEIMADMNVGEPEKPHIVLFISDDHGYDDSGANGDKMVKTPVNEME